MPGLKKGLAALPSTGENAANWLKMKSGDSVTVAPVVGLDELISINQHALWRPGGQSPIFMCIGVGCPGCQLGDKAKFKAFLPVLCEDGTTKIFSFGRNVAIQLSEYDKEFDGGLKGKRLKIKRTGEGLTTKWSIIMNGAQTDVSGAELPDIEGALGPQTRDGILELMAEKGFDYEGELKAFKEASAPVVEEEETVPVKSPAKGKGKAKKDDDEWTEI